MFQQNQFSLYSLEDSEEYWGNTAVTYYYSEWDEVIGEKKGHIRSMEKYRPTHDDKPASRVLKVEGMRRMEGTLHLASRSLTFEPNEASDQMMQFPLDVIGECTGINVLDKHESQGLVFRSWYCFVTAENGRVCPHRPLKVPASSPPFQIFTLQWDAAFLDLIRSCQQHSSAPPLSSKFDYSSLPLTESILYECNVELIEPLLSIPAAVVLSDKNIYFHSRYSCVPPECVNLSDIKRCEMRRCVHRDTALELQLEQGVKFINLSSDEERDALFRAIKQTPLANLPKSESLLSAMEGWVNGKVSTFDYLMFLNWVSGRTTSDLSSYPVLPWVLADYESSKLNLDDPSSYRDLALPIGALNVKRLEDFKARMQESQEPYLYGTHYSCPGYVMYYLLRDHPEWMLKMHNGEFDKPDRMFDSVSQCWNNVNHLSNDLKELIPQFFVGDGSFLTSSQELNLGVKECGQSVGSNIVLPPWASSPEDFIIKNRDALESEHCSKNIHKWIDLIFGFKSRGEQAFQANNLFHPITYDGTAEIEKEQDPTLRSALVSQMREFGQCPLQVFHTPHPQRAVGATARHLINRESWAPPVKEEAYVSNASMCSVDRSLLASLSPSPSSPPAASNPLHSALLMSVDLLDDALPPYSLPSAVSVIEEGELPHSPHGIVMSYSSSKGSFMQPENDVEFSDILFQCFVAENNNKLLDDMVWFVPKNGEAYVRRTNTSTFPARRSPAVAWAETVFLNLAVQWECEITIAVVHEPPREDGTLFAADWIAQRVYASPTGGRAGSYEDENDSYSITYPSMNFSTLAGEETIRVPQGAFLWAVELNVIVNGKKVPVKRAAAGHVDLARRFEESSPSTSKHMEYMSIDESSVQLCAWLDEQSSKWLGFGKKTKKASESVMICKLCCITIDRLNLISALQTSLVSGVTGVTSDSWLYLPPETFRSCEPPPKYLPEMQDVETFDSLPTPIPTPAPTPADYMPPPPSLVSTVKKPDHLLVTSEKTNTKRQNEIVPEEKEKRKETAHHNGEHRPPALCEVSPKASSVGMVTSADKSALEIDIKKSIELKLPSDMQEESAEDTAEETDEIPNYTMSTKYEYLPSPGRQRSHALMEASIDVYSAQSTWDMMPSDSNAAARWKACFTNTPMLADVSNSCEGYMWGYEKHFPVKRIGKNYSKRLFIRSGSLIYCFPEAAETTLARGCIFLYGARLKKRRRRAQPHYVLQINSTVPRRHPPRTSDEDRTFHLAFPTEADRDSFATIITPAIIRLIA